MHGMKTVKTQIKYYIHNNNNNNKEAGGAAALAERGKARKYAHLDRAYLF